MIRTMTINSTSNEEFLTKTLEYQQKILCYINQMITKDDSSQLLCQGELGLSIGERSEYYIRPQMQGILYFWRQIMQVEERHMYPLQYIVQLINCLVFSTRTKIKEISMPFFTSQSTIIVFFYKASIKIKEIACLYVQSTLECFTFWYRF